MEGGRRCYGRGQRGVSCESSWPVRCAPGHLSAIAAVLPGRTALRGKSSRTTRYTWGLVIRGIFPPPILLQGQQERPGQQAHGDVVMPTRPEPAPYLIWGAGLVFVQAPRRSSRSLTRFQCASGSRPHRPRSPEMHLGVRWTGSSGARCRPGSGDKPPTGPHQASASWSPAPVWALNR